MSNKSVWYQISTVLPRTTTQTCAAREPLDGAVALEGEDTRARSHFLINCNYTYNL